MSTPLPPLWVIGAGRLGATLLRDLAVAGVAVRGWARPSPRRDLVQAWLRAQGLQGVELAAELPPDLPAVVLAVPDREIASAAAALRQQGARIKVLLHCAGAMPVDPLRVSAALACGSCHPLAAVPDPLAPRPAPSPLQGALFAVDGDPAALALARQLAEVLGGVAVAVAAEQRAAYHAAAALIANDWVALADAALRTARSAGLPDAELRRGLLHLASTALGALQNLPDDQSLLRGLTGAVARGDAPTLAKHLEVIADPQVRELHRQASALLVEQCRDQGLLPAAAVAQLRAVLRSD